MNKKKLKELAALKTVQRIYSGFPGGEIIPFERPDFLIKNGIETVGFEIVDFVRWQSENGSPKRHEESVQNQICTYAEEIFKSRNDEDLYVLFQSSVHNSLSELNKNQRKKIAKLIVEKIKNSIPDNFLKSYKIHVDWEVDEELFKYISSIYVMKLREKSLWRFIQADWISATKEDVQRVIDGKNKKHFDYRDRSQINWLIIVAWGTQMSSTVDISNIAEEIFASDFDKVLFLFYEEDTVIELNTTKCTGGNYDSD